MRIVFSEAVLIDVLSGKGRSASALMEAVAEGKVQGSVMLSTLTSIRRSAESAIGPKRAAMIVSELAFILDILPMPSKEDILISFNSEGRLDDALLMASAYGNADFIITRSRKAFEGSRIPAMTPREMLMTLESGGSV